MRTWVGWAIVIVAIIIIGKNPAGAAHTVRHWADSAATFVTNL